MHKNIIQYIVAFILTIIVLVFFNIAYKSMFTYAELANRHNTVRIDYNDLSKQLNNAAVLNPDLGKAGSYSSAAKLFFTDSVTIIQQLNTLRSLVRDSINIQIVDKLDSLIKPEISWLLKSNVPDSIIEQHAQAHILAYQRIDSLVNKGIQRTNFLIEYRKELLNKEIKRIRLWMLLFILLSGVVLTYTTINLFRQQSKRERKEKELEGIWNRINDAVISVDSNWRYTFLNDAAMATHTSRQDVLGKVMWDVHPEMKGTVFWDKYHEAMRTGKVVETESYYAPMDIWFSVKIYPSVDGLTIFYKDFSERKKLEEQQQLFASIVNSSDDAILSKTLDGKITTWNHGAEKIFGYTAEDIIGKHISILIPPQLQHEENMIMQKIQSGKSIDHYETERRRKDGTVINVSLTISPIRNSLGNIIGASKISRDITERKKIQEQLIEREKQLELFIEHSPAALAMFDTQMNYIAISRKWITDFGLTGRQLIGKSHYEIFPEISQQWKDIHQRSLKGSVEQNEEELFTSASGIKNWLKWEVHPWRKASEEIGGIIIFSEFITARKEAEEKLSKSEKIYKTIASSIPDSIICLLDSDYRYLLMEGDMMDELGFSKQLLLGNKAADVLPAEIFERVQPDFKHAFEGQTITKESNKSGHDIISRFIPLKDEDNIVYAIMTVSMDVTPLKKAQKDIAELNRGLEEKINKRTEELKKSNEELEAFSYSVSHDLRAPLRAVNGYAKILEEDYSNIFDNEGKRLLGEVKNNATKMGTLIDDLLSFSRLGRKEVQKAAIDMDKLVEHTIWEIGQSTVHQATINYKRLIACNADPALLQHVMINLISNAIKYSSKEKTPVIDIRSQHLDGEVMYAIADNGVGFDMKYKHKLFGVFQRLHSSDDFPGTGVGLAIVERIIQKHNGKIWAESGPGKGATFSFTLPDN